MPSLSALMRKNENGDGTKPAINVRAPKAFKLALEQRARQLGLSMSKTLVQAALRGDPELRALARRYAKTGE